MKTPLSISRARCLCSGWLLAVLAIQLPARADQIIYDDARQNSWQDWGWASINYLNTSPVHSGSDSISVTIVNGWDGIQLWHSDQDSTPYASLSFWIHGGSSGGQKLQVYGLIDVGGTNNFATSPRYYIGPLEAGTWQQIAIPLSALNVASVANFTGFVIQDSQGTAEPAFYVDDISLVANAVTAGTNAPVSISVDAQANGRTISPLIYGVAFATMRLCCGI